MADEAVLVQLREATLFQVTVANGTSIEKGTVLKWSADPNTAAASTADGDLFAGILAEEKVASDGQTEVAVWRAHSVVTLKTSAGGTAVLGAPVKIDGANLIDVADDDTIENSGQVVGIALETGGNAEVIQVLLGR